MKSGELSCLQVGLALLLITALVDPTLAAEADGDGIIEEGEDESEELAKAAQNPVANLISLPFQNNTDFDYGPRDKTQNTLNIQPVWPFEITENWNLITRTIVPIVSQPSLAAGQDRETGLGDITFTGFMSPSDSGKVTWGVGPIVLFPSATDNRLGADKWGLGPSIVVLGMPGNWVVGSLFSNVWSVGGSGNEDVNLFTWQVIANYNLSDGWYLTSTPIITSNWEAKSSDEWTVPVGGGFGKIFKIDSLASDERADPGLLQRREARASLAAGAMRVQLQLMFPKSSLMNPPPR